MEKLISFLFQPFDFESIHSYLGHLPFWSHVWYRISSTRLFSAFWNICFAKLPKILKLSKGKFMLFWLLWFGIKYGVKTVCPKLWLLEPKKRYLEWTFYWNWTFSMLCLDSESNYFDHTGLKFFSVLQID